MNAALFCHAEGSSLEKEVQQELTSQYTLLDRYAHQQGFSIEYAAFHTGSLCTPLQDRVLSDLLQQAHAKQFEIILVKSKACFPHSLQAYLPPIQIAFLQEAQWLQAGSSAAPALQQLPTLPADTVVYWRQASRPCSTSSCNRALTMS